MWHVANIAVGAWHRMHGMQSMLPLLIGQCLAGHASCGGQRLPGLSLHVEFCNDFHGFDVKFAFTIGPQTE